jgi:hypothetical protein
MENDQEMVSLSGSRSASVSLQVYQQIYNDLTGKSEHLRRMWLDPHVIKFSDLEGLHHRLEQCAEQYRCHASHAQISVRYSNQEGERFSSFEKFARLGLNRNSSTEEVELVYDFLIELPHVQEPKPYRIELGFRSEIGVVDGFARNKVSDAEVSLFHQFSMGRARIDISYIDIAVARSFEASIASWYEALQKNHEKPFSGFSRLLAPSAGVLARIAGLVAATFLLLLNLSAEVHSNQEIFERGLVAALALMVTNIFGIRLGNFVEKMVLRRRPLSAVILSECDKRLLGAQRFQFWHSVASSCGGFLGGILIGLASAYIGRLIGLS